MTDNFKSNLIRLIQECKSETGQEIHDFITWLFVSVDAHKPEATNKQFSDELVKFIRELEANQ